MKVRMFKKILSSVLAIALLVTGMSIADTQKAKAAATVESAADYTVTAEEISASTTKLTFNASSYAAYVARETFMIYYNMGLEEYNSALLPGSEIVRD